MKLKAIIAVATLSLLVLGCSKDDPTPSIPGVGGGGGNNSSFTANIDGALFQPPSILTTGTLAGNPGPFTLNATGVTIGGGDTTTVSISVIGLDFNAIVAGGTYLGTGDLAIEPIAVGNYLLHNGNGTPIGATSENNMTATATITAIDKTAQVFSGTFEFTAVDDNQNVTRVVTNGVFTDLEY